MRSKKRGVLPCFRKTGVIGGLALTLLSPADNWAQESTLRVKKPVSANSSSPKDTQQQLKALQSKMDAIQKDYQAKLLRMQITIDRLTAHMNKGDYNAPPLVTKPVDPDDKDLGEVLIFGSDETGNPSPALATSPSVTPNPSRSNINAGLGGIGGRSLYNPMTQPLNSGNFANRLGQSMNPDMVVSGDFVGHYANRKGTENRNRISLRETEFGFSAAVDPYAKATFLFSKPDNEALEVEEGYITLLSLPYNLQAKIGKMRSPFGKINVIHNHDLPQTDRPNVYTHFFGEEGLVESGIGLSTILPFPWYSALDVQVANGDTSSFFGKGSLSKPLLISHWKNFFDLSTTQSVEVGASNAFGSRSSTENSRLSNVLGLDVTYHWIPPDQRHALIWQTEILSAQREHPFTGASNGLWGGYSYMEYKLNQRWSIGARVDYSETPLVANAQEFAIAPYVNFWESEFGRWRMEYKHTFSDGSMPSNDQLWLQYSAILGLHPPHTF